MPLSLKRLQLVTIRRQTNMLKYAKRLTADLGSTTAEVVILVPLLVLLIATILQFTLLQRANEVCEAASAYGERFAELYQATPDETKAAITSFMVSQGDNLKNYQILISITQYSVTVNIKGYVPSFIPFLHLQVSASSIGNQQMFRPYE